MCLKKLRKNCSNFVRLLGKIINIIQSISFRLDEIIADYLFKISQSNFKTMFRSNINKTVFSDKAFQSYSFGWKISQIFFWIFLFNKCQIWWKIPYPKKNPGYNPVLGSSLKYIHYTFIHKHFSNLSNDLSNYQHNEFCLNKYLYIK